MLPGRGLSVPGAGERARAEEGDAAGVVHRGARARTFRAGLRVLAVCLEKGETLAGHGPQKAKQLAFFLWVRVSKPFFGCVFLLAEPILAGAPSELVCSQVTRASPCRYLYRYDTRGGRGLGQSSELELGCGHPATRQRPQLSGSLPGRCSHTPESGLTGCAQTCHGQLPPSPRLQTRAGFQNSLCSCSWECGEGVSQLLPRTQEGTEPEPQGPGGPGRCHPLPCRWLQGPGSAPV